MNEYVHYTDEELLLLLGNDDEGAYTTLYFRHAGNIYRAAMTFLQDEFIAEETVQTVFLGIWERRSKMKEVGQLKDYLFIVARNSIYAYLKKLARERAGLKDFGETLEQSIQNTEFNLEEKDYNRLVQEAVDKLPEQRKKIYSLSREHHLSHKEISEQLGISPLTVKKQISLAQQSIREHLNQNHSFTLAISLLIAAAVQA
ncbi:RNA polymerase sigma-70 factor [Pinibacter aurantiacus]|uniref:RNA polymerase sigma-70 factor n=1 Tax=Pinibacter aurantiacus TaxID=2851599 RepID=A0A9E2SB16_9BACT|nr:RNA polymerase sigma-70 factor [Pinibacter aurantiacus]MBV4358842.1 RNA polymerase sigma-70 factor [Pinibacter aurantiacus]